MGDIYLPDPTKIELDLWNYGLRVQAVVAYRGRHEEWIGLRDIKLLFEYWQHLTRGY